MDPVFAATINRFAGAHAISSDAQEVAAALRAGEASLREFPYYLARYGERGRLFAGSDGAWLVTVCDAGEEVAREEVLWVGRVLSSRGIPRRLLERHLLVLHGELTRTFAERAPRYAPLAAAAAHLAARRRGRISDAETDELTRGFLDRADPAVAARLPEMATILAGAAADEADGIARAVESVESWAADPDRFSPSWISAVEQTLAAARRICASRGGAPG